ncbi:MAG: hypothetical protein ACI8T1_002979, partial [Verrucomicrobiales bacterium]
LLELKNRRFDDQRWAVLMLDGIRLSKDLTAVVALGITEDGQKSSQNCPTARRNDPPPIRTILDRQSSLIVRTNRSAKAFRFGDRTGSLTDFTPTLSRIFSNSPVNSVALS